MSTLIACLLSLNTLIFLLVSLVHFYWAFGGIAFYSAALPEIENTGKKVFKPGKIVTGVVAILFLCVATGFLLLVIGKNWFAPKLNIYFLGAISTVTFLRAVGDFKYIGFFKKKLATKFAVNDTRFYSPLCLYISVTSCAALLFLFKG